MELSFGNLNPKIVTFVEREANHNQPDRYLHGRACCGDWVIWYCFQAKCLETGELKAVMNGQRIEMKAVIQCADVHCINGYIDWGREPGVQLTQLLRQMKAKRQSYKLCEGVKVQKWQQDGENNVARHCVKSGRIAAASLCLTWAQWTKLTGATET